jgi:hypothetical protein
MNLKFEISKFVVLNNKIKIAIFFPLLWLFFEALLSIFVLETEAAINCALFSGSFSKDGV